MKSLLIFSILIISCNKVTAPNDYQVKKEYYESGELKRIVTYNYDNMTAEMTVYYKDGALMGKACMIMGIIDGKWTTYMLDGDILGEYMYENGQLITEK